MSMLLMSMEAVIIVTYALLGQRIVQLHHSSARMLLVWSAKKHTDWKQHLNYVKCAQCVW